MVNIWINPNHQSVVPYIVTNTLNFEPSHFKDMFHGWFPKRSRPKRAFCSKLTWDLLTYHDGSMCATVVQIQGWSSIRIYTLLALGFSLWDGWPYTPIHHILMIYITYIMICMYSDVCIGTHVHPCTLSWPSQSSCLRTWALIFGWMARTGSGTRWNIRKGVSVCFFS